MSDLVNTRDLTDQQSRFVRAVVDGNPIPVAAELAGYARTACYYVARHPQIAAAIHVEVARRLTTEAAPIAYKVGMGILKDEKAGARVRADLALKFLSMAGHGADKGGNANPDKPLSEMSSDELHEYLRRNQAEIDRLENELASRAKEVITPDNTPKGDVIDANPLEYLD